MKVTTIKFMKRKNLGNYEHEELSMEAILSEDESATAATLQLIFLVNNALNGNQEEVEETKTELVTEKKVLKPLGNEPAATANIVKEKAAPRTRAKPVLAETPPEIPAEAATVETPSANAGGTPAMDKPAAGKDGAKLEQKKPVASASVDKNVVLYSPLVKEQRSRFATFLGTTYPKWKTAHPEDKIKAFSLALEGKPFEDNKGNMLDSFKAELEAFFGHAR